MAVPLRQFSKPQKLLSKQDYAHVFARPGKRHHKYFTILFRHGNSPETRLGLAVSRKAMRRAVARNRFKRIARESFRHHFAKQTPATEQATIAASENGSDLNKAPLDIVIIAKAAAASASRQELRQAFDEQWKALTA